jgi:hypothetical protein
MSVLLCISLSLLGNGSVKTFARQLIDIAIEELLPSYACGYLYLLLGNNSLKTFPRQRIIVGGVVLYAVLVVLKKSMLSVLPRTYSIFYRSNLYYL